jgi:hypothetical protein
MIVGSSVAAVVLAVVVYLLFVQPWHLRWGASQHEATSALPGDEIVPAPDYQCTHAITIDAAVEDVWPWLVQIGQDRGGFYSYAWLENLLGMEIHNADRIVPEWQHLAVGGCVGLAPGVHMKVTATEPGRWVVFDMPLAEKTSWAFVLDPIGPQTTRFIIRMRMDAWGQNVYLSPFDPGHFIMERKMLLSIKQLAEAAAGVAPGRSFKETLWFGSVIVAGLAILGLLFTNRWPWTLAFAAAGAVLWVLTFFLGHPSPLYAGALALGLLVALLWSVWPPWPLGFM